MAHNETPREKVHRLIRQGHQKEAPPREVTPEALLQEALVTMRDRDRMSSELLTEIRGLRRAIDRLTEQIDILTEVRRQA